MFEHWTDGDDENARLSRLRDVHKALPNRGLEAEGLIIAATHPWAIQYLQQCPLFAIFCRGGWSRGNSSMSRMDKRYIAMKMGETLKDRPALKKAMAALNIPFPMRKIRGTAVQPNRSRLYLTIAHAGLSPSELSQAIPEKTGQQQWWLREVEDFELRMDRLGDQELCKWAIIQAGAMVAANGAGRKDGTFSTIADLFLRSGRHHWHPKLTWKGAARAAEAWHTNLRRERDEKKFFDQVGIGFEDLMDYGNYPDTAEYSGYRFVALRSGKALHEEGAAMRHCVASYGPDILEGGSRIYSIRDDKDERVATVEVAPTKAPLGGPGIRQLQGKCGQVVRASVRQAVALFLTDLLERHVMTIRPKKKRTVIDPKNATIAVI